MFADFQELAVQDDFVKISTAAGVSDTPVAEPVTK